MPLPDWPQVAARVLLFTTGAAIAIFTILSAVRTFVLPRSANDPLTRAVFLTSRRLFNFRLRKAITYEDRDRVMAMYAPLTLLALPPTWLLLVLIGFMGMFRALGVPSWYESFRLSGSSLLTLGFATTASPPQTILAITEATIGLILVAILIAYLPTMYAAFSRREALVAQLEVRAGDPPTAVELFARAYRLNRIVHLNDLWTLWEVWFAELEESHTSLAALVFFRSPVPARSWITAAGAVLDAASLAASTLDIPRDMQTDLCIRAGYIALRRIADFFRIPYDGSPKYGDPISISRSEFDDVCDQLAAASVPLKADRDQCWRDFAGWRVNYDTVLLALAALTMAPYAPWSSDRSPYRPLSGSRQDRS